MINESIAMTLPFKHIACAIDFSKHTQPVLQWATGMARRFNARLTVLHVIHPQRDKYSGTALFERGGERDQLMREAAESIEALMAPFDIAWMSAVLTGDPVEEISAYARRQSIDLMVAASHGISGLKRLLMGTVIERMARMFNGPLLVLPGLRSSDSPALDFEKIVVACDLSPGSQTLIDHGTAFAREFKSRLYVLHTIEAPVQEQIVEPSAGPYGQVQDQLQNEIIRRLENMVGSSQPQGIAVAIEVQPGVAEEQLGDFIREQRVDLVVVGVRPQTRFEKMLIGSTTEMVLRRAACAVLTIPVSPDSA